MDSRIAYQILRDRFHGKHIKDAVLTVINDQSLVVLTATIYNMNESFCGSFKIHESLITEITTLFKKVVDEYRELGFEVKFGKPSYSMMEELDNFFAGRQYTKYLKNKDIVIQVSLNIPDNVDMM